MLLLCSCKCPVINIDITALVSKCTIAPMVLRAYIINTPHTYTDQIMK